jgi:glycosyltransferase involved in cell wall biosynthesis
VKFLFCSEFFHPSVGGVQEVVKQISVDLVRRGHDVTVATSVIESRTGTEIDGVKIVEFLISGNWVRGLSGEIDRYRNFVCTGAFDAVFIYAAQQWTLDCLLDVLPNITTRKVLVPCGFSSFYQAEYQNYFKRLAIDLKYFECLVFHSRSYRDYKFLSAIYEKSCVLIPNGAVEEEFLNVPDHETFRDEQEIAPDSFAILTIGALNGAKGHLELAKAVANLKTKRPVHVILNGNSMPHASTLKGASTVDIAQVLSPRYIYQQARKLAWQGLNIRKAPVTTVLAIA